MRERKWCTHIKFKDDFGEMVWFDIVDWERVEDYWKFCPICGTPRPKEAKSD